MPILAPKASEIRSTDSWITEALENIVPMDTYKGRNPVFLRVINRMKAKGLLQKEVELFLSPWGKKHDYEIKLLKLIQDQYNRYPAPAQRIDGIEDAENLESFLANEEEYKWIIPDIIAEGTLSFFSGLPESRKTWLAMDLALEVAKGGGKWVGSIPVNGGPVVFIDQERPKKETQRRLRALMKAKGLTAKDLNGRLFVKSGTSIRINLQHSFDAFKKFLSEVRPKLVIIDSFVAFHTAEENNRKDIQTVLESIKSLRDEFECAFIFVDHENKGAFQNSQNEEERVSFDKLSGSIAKSAAAETIFTIRPHDEDRSMVYHTKASVGDKLPPFMVKVVNIEPDKSKIAVIAG